MKVKITNAKRNYLKLTFIQENQSLRNILQDNTNIIDINVDTMDELRDWASNKLQVVGFDMNYSLTEEGKILESLIDKLYH